MSSWKLLMSRAYTPHENMDCRATFDHWRILNRHCQASFVRGWNCDTSDHITHYQSSNVHIREFLAQGRYATVCTIASCVVPSSKCLLHAIPVCYVGIDMRFFWVWKWFAFASHERNLQTFWLLSFSGHHILLPKVILHFWWMWTG